eukprot:m.1001462 g.1001462  ORF g.1001462 m.1001462 type:complete len:560 (-) comp24029_c1_seq1:70-1749(-)
MTGLRWPDYVVVGLYVIFAIGVGTGCSRTAGSNSNSYFLAGKGANKWIAGVSLISGITSGISFIGIPGYTFKHGIAMLAFVLGFILSIPFIVGIAIPFFAREELGCTTSYEYLEARFSRPVRTLGTVSFLVRIVLYMGFVLFAPAVALEAVADVPVYVSVLTCGILATAYTCKGGMQAVIWTDFVASLALILGVSTALAIALEGTPGGPTKLFSDAKDHVLPAGYWDNNPLLAVNFWCMCFGFLFNTAAQSGTDQIAVQRYLATKSVRDAQMTALGGICGNIGMTLLLVFLGFALYGYFLERDLPAEILKDTDKIFPYFFTNELPSGVAGLILASLCATTMSVFAGGINAATTSLIVDILQNYKFVSTRGGGGMSTVKLAKLLTVLCGVLAIGIAIAAQYVHQSLSLITSVAQAVCCAPTFGMFVLGMSNQRATSVDAIAGFVAAIAFMVYCLVGASYCPDDSNSAGSQHAKPLPDVCHNVLLVARVSEWLYAALGSTVCVAVGCLSMWLRRGVPPPPANVMGLTWGTRHMPADTRSGTQVDRYEHTDAAQTPLLSAVN